MRRLLDLVDFARREGLSLRCIEYMDVGSTKRMAHADVVSGEEILERVAAVYRCWRRTPIQVRSRAPIDSLMARGSGVITSVSRPSVAIALARVSASTASSTPASSQPRASTCASHCDGAPMTNHCDGCRRPVEASRRSLFRAAWPRRRRGERIEMS